MGPCNEDAREGGASGLITVSIGTVRDRRSSYFQSTTLCGCMEGATAKTTHPPYPLGPSRPGPGRAGHRDTSPDTATSNPRSPDWVSRGHPVRTQRVCAVRSQGCESNPRSPEKGIHEGREPRHSVSRQRRSQGCESSRRGCAHGESRAREPRHSVSEQRDHRDASPIHAVRRVAVTGTRAKTQRVQAAPITRMRVQSSRVRTRRSRGPESSRHRCGQG